jgi:hypothetical protein
MTAAAWSAIAATFAALSSFLILLVQRQNLLYSLRPELVLVDWGRQSKEIAGVKNDRITFKTMRNFGRGAALHPYVNEPKEGGDRTKYLVVGGRRYPTLAQGEVNLIDGEIILFWANVEGEYLPVNIEIVCWDAGNIRHEVRYNLMVVKTAYSQELTGDEIAPGVTLGTRSTKSVPVWLLKLVRRLGSVKVRKPPSTL